MKSTLLYSDQTKSGIAVVRAVPLAGQSHFIPMEVPERVAEEIEKVAG